MTTRHLCAAPRCAIRGQHAPDCGDEGCRGCAPRAAADGLNLCDRCAERAGHDLAALPELYADLVLVLATSGRPGERVSGGTSATLTLNEGAAVARSAIESKLALWSITVAEKRGVHPPPIRREEDLVPVLAPWLRLHLEWLAAYSGAGDFADEMSDLVHDGRRFAYPNGARTFVVGPCPREVDGQPCPGEIRAILRRTDALLPSELACSERADHRWDSTQWVRLGRELIGRAA